MNKEMLTIDSMDNELAAGLSRRTMLKGAAAITAAMAGGSAMANGHHSDGSHHQALIESTLQCIRDGEACMHHLVTELASGNTDLGACAHKVSESLSVCNALVTMASHDSEHLPAVAQVAAVVKKDCQTECEKHAAEHETCRALAQSCAACISECENLEA